MEILSSPVNEKDFHVSINVSFIYMIVYYTCRLKWSDVIKPAIKIAKEGFRVTEHTGEAKNLCPITDNHRVQWC